MACRAAGVTSPQLQAANMCAVRAFVRHLSAADTSKGEGHVPNACIQCSSTCSMLMGLLWLLLLCRYLYEVAPTNRRCLVVAFGWSGVVSNLVRVSVPGTALQISWSFLAQQPTAQQRLNPYDIPASGFSFDSSLARHSRATRAHNGVRGPWGISRRPVQVQSIHLITPATTLVTV